MKPSQPPRLTGQVQAHASFPGAVQPPLTASLLIQPSLNPLAKTPIGGTTQCPTARMGSAELGEIEQQLQRWGDRSLRQLRFRIW
ncbi:hypothetical protein H6G89_29735 [Oscillatoria sp. FACHB-1407]|uniref:hypothetical protein n=1 Tax=Oscillatoria sp. FACHB-1407 TaxID=2692847 RepID=UPI001689D7F1|nr:hypothetical protein [Oscillatoria sp. FACHB-1407]MBD2465194.1 hypothetical protein [Oscillatoria sp. FACHB-1407]